MGERIARTLAETDRPWVTRFAFSQRVRLLARVAGRAGPVDVTQAAKLAVAPGNAALWEVRLSRAAAEDIATVTPLPGSARPLVEGGSSDRFLRHVLTRLRSTEGGSTIVGLGLVYAYGPRKMSFIAGVRAE